MGILKKREWTEATLNHSQQTFESHILTLKYKKAPHHSHARAFLTLRNSSQLQFACNSTAMNVVLAVCQ